LVISKLSNIKKKDAWILDFDVLPFDEATKLQDWLVVKRSEGKVEDIFILLEHPPVFTVPRKRTLINLRVSLDEVKKKGILICRTNRGGDITYHGPGQLVGYLIVDLKNQGRDLHKYVYKIEKMLIGLLKDYNISAYRESQYPGVWVKNEKIASLGIALKTGWITMHGFSLNVDLDLSPYSLIIPCGIPGKKVISMENVLGKTVDKQKLRRRLTHHFSDVFNREVKNINLDDIK